MPATRRSRVPRASRRRGGIALPGAREKRGQRHQARPAEGLEARRALEGHLAAGLLDVPGDVLGAGRDVPDEPRHRAPSAARIRRRRQRRDVHAPMPGAVSWAGRRRGEGGPSRPHPRGRALTLGEERPPPASVAERVGKRCLEVARVTALGRCQRRGCGTGIGHDPELELRCDDVRRDLVARAPHARRPGRSESPPAAARRAARSRPSLRRRAARSEPRRPCAEPPRRVPPPTYMPDVVRVLRRRRRRTPGRRATSASGDSGAARRHRSAAVGRPGSARPAAAYA